MVEHKERGKKKGGRRIFMELEKEERGGVMDEEKDMYGDYIIISEPVDEDDPVIREALDLLKQKLILVLEKEGKKPYGWEPIVRKDQIPVFKDRVYEMMEKLSGDDILDYIQKQEIIEYQDVISVGLKCKARNKEGTCGAKEMGKGIELIRGVEDGETIKNKEKD